MAITGIPGLGDSLHFSMLTVFFQRSTFTGYKCCLLFTLLILPAVRRSIPGLVLRFLYILVHLLQINWQVTDSDGILWHEVGYTLQHVLQLAYISRPAVLSQ